MLARTLTAAAFLCAVEGARIKRRSSVACGAKGLSAASNQTSIQIVNGQDADECEWKWQVGLWSRWAKKPWDKPFCGGTLIDAEWVLTAAHCVGNGNPNFDVVVGSFKNSKNNTDIEQRQSASQVFKHPRYNPNTQSKDYALVKVPSPFKFNQCVGTACLPTGGDVAAGTKCWITGWGTLRSGGSQPDTLQEAEVSIISNRDCVENFEYYESDIDASMLCAQGSSNGDIRDACQGDSGGPLVCQTDSGEWGVYGATSWGYGCAESVYPGVWARVHEELAWIDSVMNQ